MALSLNQIGAETGTDKSRHGYLPFYESHFKRENPRSLLELGVLGGASLQMWKRYFPKCRVEGWDQEVRWDKKVVEGCKLKIVNLNSRAEIENAADGAQWDVIIDDASHTMQQQQLTFSALFEKSKFFVMEDLHTSWSAAHKSSPTRRTTFDLVVNLGTGGRPWDAECASPEEAAYISRYAELVAVYWVENLKGPRSVTAIVRNRARSRD